MSARDLELSLMLKLVDKLTGPASLAERANRRLARSLGDTKDQLQQLKQATKNVQHLQALQQQLGGVTTQLSDAQREAAYFRDQMQKAYGTKNHKTLLKEYEAAKKKAGQLLATKNELTQTVNNLDGALKKAGVDTRNLADAEKQLVKQSDQLNSKLEKQKTLYRKLQQLPKAMGERWKNLKSGAGSFAKWGAGAAIGGAMAIGTAGMPMLNKAAQFEGYQTTLTTIEGSSAKAKASMEWISKFAAKTPYEMGEVNEAFVRLRSYGLDPTNGLLKTLGDTSASMGKPVMQAVEAIADAVTGENERLKEFGITARAEGDLFHYEYTGKDGVQRTLSALKDDRKAIESVLRRIWSEKFDGGMEAQSKTWTGIVSNISDQWGRFQLMIMNSGPFEKLKGHLLGFLARLEKMEKDGSLKKWAEEIGTRIVVLIDQVGAFGKRLWELGQSAYSGASKVAMFVGGWENLAFAVASLKLFPVITSFSQLVTAMKDVGGGLKWLGKMAKAHPLIAVATGIALAAGLVIANWDSISDYFGALSERFKQAGHDILAGLAQGIQDGMNWVKEKILALGELLPAWLRKKLDIHSPSRVFAGIGGHISEGVGVGIEGKAKSALAAVQRLGRRLPSALPAALAMGLTAGAATAAPAGPSAAAAGGGVTIYEHNEFHIHVGAGADTRELEQMIRRLIEERERAARARARSRLIDEV